jgi:hypothetical protein
MLVAMADLALVPAGLPDLAWVAALLAAAVTLAATLRHAPPDTGADCRRHMLHVGCLLAMATLTAAMAGPAAGLAPVVQAGRHHAPGADALTVLGLGSAAAFVIASCVVAAGPGRRTADRVGALAGAVSVALMAAAVLT